MVIILNKFVGFIMKKIIILLMLFSVAFLNSCDHIKYMVKGNFTNLFDGKLTGLDSLINIDGYYHTIGMGTFTYTYYMFYRDGTFTSDFCVMSTNIPEDSHVVGKLPGWGHYIISGETIKTQAIVIHGEIYWFGVTAPILLTERWFKIINKDTLFEIYFNDFKKHENSWSWSYLNTKAAFHPLKSKPDSTCWLKEKSWAWKDGKLIK